MTKKDLDARKEDKLLLLCARTRIDDEVRSEIASILKQGIEWDYLLKRSSDHKLTPLLYWQIKDLGNDRVPSEVMEHLKSFFDENVRRNLLFLGELLKILELFKAHNINVIPYKGPVLAIQAYGNLSLRQFDDLDVFIQKKDFLVTKEILISRGYMTQLNLEDAQEKKYLQSQREYKFINPEINMALEIHWNFVGLSFSGDWDYFENPENFKPTKIQDINVLSPKPEDMLLVLCIHASGHFWERLSWICDIAEFIQSNKNLDWQYLMETANKLRINRILKVNLLLAVDLFGMKVTDEILESLKFDESLKALAFDIENNLLNDFKSGIFAKAVWRLKIRENRSDKIKDLLRLLFISTINEWKVYVLPSFLYPLYYILRPMNLLRKDY